MTNHPNRSKRSTQPDYDPAAHVATYLAAVGGRVARRDGVRLGIIVDAVSRGPTLPVHMVVEDDNGKRHTLSVRGIDIDDANT